MTYLAVLCPKKAIDWARVKKAVLAQPDISPEVLPHIAGDYVDMFKLPDDAPNTASGREPMRVVTAGTGLMMISRQCLLNLIDKAELPAISFGGSSGPSYPIYEFFRCMNDGTRMRGEDFYFCSLVNRHGGGVYGCAWVMVTHTGAYTHIGDLLGVTRYT